VVPPPVGEQTIISPSVGVFRRAPGPGAAPFIEVGQAVKAGDTVGVLEVMKRMSNIPADVDGVITALHVGDAGAVEFGSPLVSIKAGA
jgi:acetyl-CoA carboxylase biotin carboxyl carrier protein